MGCNSSKAATAQEGPYGGKHSKHSQNNNGKGPSTAMSKKVSSKRMSHQSASGSGSMDHDGIPSTISASKPERLYKLLAKAQQSECSFEERQRLYQQVLIHCQQEPMAVKWQNPNTKSTPLHLAARLMDSDTSEALLQVVETLMAIHNEALCTTDAAGKIPLHYAIAPTTHFTKHNTNANNNGNPQRPNQSPFYNWKARAVFVRHMILADRTTAQWYLSQNNMVYASGDATGGCSPLYRVLQTLEDDFDPSSPTADYVSVVQSAYPEMTGIGNASDGDKPLSLLYRRFTRQFDISEKFFAGDNSRPEVVDHRKHYKIAAGNTWKIIELLLRPPPPPPPPRPSSLKQQQQQQTQQPNQPWGIVHRAVQVETPPDLLRYIVETNAQDLTRVDPAGNLPLHYAAANKPRRQQQQQGRGGGAADTAKDTNSNFPAFYTKYVVDELLYKFPEGASMPDASGQFPLTLAIQSGKQWIGGGIKSLYDAYPDALGQTNLEEHHTLQRALSLLEEEEEDDNENNNNNNNENHHDDEDKEMGPTAGKDDDIIKDEFHDAIMLVQQPGVDISEVATSMWAHEEDAGVQMLGCVAISNLLTDVDDQDADDDTADLTRHQDILRIALTAVAAVVNAMKAHPNEMIVQEKACQALKHLAPADGQREVSMVASGAVAAIVGAMQAHVGDPGVQEHACAAVARIVHYGGADRATVVASVSGVTAIINAIAAHSGSLQVQLAGMEALQALTEFPHANLPELPKTQTEPLLLAAQQQFPDHAGLERTITVLLSRMS